MYLNMRSYIMYLQRTVALSLSGLDALGTGARALRPLPPLRPRPVHRVRPLLPILDALAVPTPLQENRKKK
jgi:hypothetical protein